jgi:hypothetical protein
MDITNNNSHLPVTNFAIVGMAGILSGLFHAPLTAIFHRRNHWRLRFDGSANDGFCLCHAVSKQFENILWM